MHKIRGVFRGAKGAPAHVPPPRDFQNGNQKRRKKGVGGKYERKKEKKGKISKKVKFLQKFYNSASRVSFAPPPKKKIKTPVLLPSPKPGS